VWLALLASSRFDLGETTIAFVGLAAFLGHLWPLFFRFNGGKGVATAAGVLMALEPLLGLLTVVTWAVIAFFLRYSSLASIIAAVFAVFFEPLYWGGSARTLAIAVMSLLLIWRHSGNIRKLLAGTESKLGHKAAPAAAAHHARTHDGHAHHDHHGKHDHGKKKGHSA
jgi:glycerol-3-phosphate acyltransferase PlsY